MATGFCSAGLTSMSLLESWTLGSHTAEGITHPTYRKGSGPGVIVIHEIPGITPAVLEFAEELVSRGLDRRDAVAVRSAWCGGDGP